ncbi:hypothetical protein [Sphingomonas quercus]|uniref:Uncharacterized protein n=1 Tax=Sphingomonas quercus TaxID=2842451 RepID=A0ABS6BDS6_9SPHN|nr:hypothetical protein [Sphingomonas quercus]MBU3076468.1 hypothetical protein [Sphingomonas quercus]
MIHVTLAITEFVMLMLSALLGAVLSVGGWLLIGGAALWGCWRLVRRKR